MTTTISIDRRGRVRAAHAVDLPFPASWVWGQMRDLPRFITWDPLHRHVEVRDGRPWLASAESPAGTRLRIAHRLLGIGPDRDARVLKWNEGRGFAFSDLSLRGCRVGFPHICVYELESIDDQRSRLVMSARGRWSSRWIPRSVARLWLRWVLVSTGVIIRSQLGRLALHVH